MKRLAFAIAAVVAAGVAAIAVVANGNAQRGGERTFTLVARGGSFHFLDNPPRQGNLEEEPPTAGDGFVGAQNLYTRAGRRAGTLGFQCTAVVGGVRPRLHCVGAYGLAGGQLMAQTVFATEERITEIAITGGTGAYRGARGYVVSRETREGSIDTIHLLP